jgi:hypothetical protein
MFIDYILYATYKAIMKTSMGSSQKIQSYFILAFFISFNLMAFFELLIYLFYQKGYKGFGNFVVYGSGIFSFMFVIIYYQWNNKFEAVIKKYSNYSKRSRKIKNIFVILFHVLTLVLFNLTMIYTSK